MRVFPYIYISVWRKHNHTVGVVLVSSWHWHFVALHPLTIVYDI